ncbi:MAG TPA: ferredoxin [Candidatus Limnocylindrales bacterium]|nr:ferredoxin [Candidatus Limnocylindrales bacterium]
MARRAHALRVDRIRCDGYGMCAELLPEMIDLDDWGYPIFRSNAIVPDRLVEHARRAVDVCPVLALRLESVIASAPPALAGHGAGHRRG